MFEKCMYTINAKDFGFNLKKNNVKLHISLCIKLATNRICLCIVCAYAFQALDAWQSYITIMQWRKTKTETICIKLCDKNKCIHFHNFNEFIRTTQHTIRANNQYDWPTNRSKQFSTVFKRNHFQRLTIQPEWFNAEKCWRLRKMCGNNKRTIGTIRNVAKRKQVFFNASFCIYSKKKAFYYSRETWNFCHIIATFKQWILIQKSIEFQLVEMFWFEQR